MKTLGLKYPGEGYYWQVKEVHTPAAVPEAPSIRKSTKFPAGIDTEPSAGQLPLVPGEHFSAVSDIAAGVPPARSVTVIFPDCSELTSSRVAVHPSGIHASTLAPSLATALGVFTA
jgi:hypothetical protein